MRIAIASDHAGYAYKKELLAFLQGQLLDFGCHSEESMDYPDVIHPLAQALQEEQADLGIIICGSGNGVAITANKYKHIRAALCWQVELAQLAREHNNANVLALPARFVSLEEAKAIVQAFLASEFAGGRHARRVEKMLPPSC